MPDFTLFIPSEIFSIVLSQVNQVDCVECMTVCRRWYKLIPSYGRNVWNELEISEKSWLRFNNAMLECLGTHVKKVSVTSYQNSSKILQQLGNQGCDIQFLEIKNTLELSSFTLDRSALFNGIGLYRRTLKELFISGACSPFHSLSLSLDLLPALTHLSIKITLFPNSLSSDNDESISEEMQQNIQSNSDDNEDPYNLVFLYLESQYVCDFDIKHVVKRCPRLKYLLASNYTGVPTIELAHILKLCPSISYIHWDGAISSNIVKEWLALSKEKRRVADSENESDYEKVESCHLRQVECCSQNGQQGISILTACFQQPSLLEHLRLSGIFYTGLNELWNRFSQHNSTLLSQPSTLKSLDLGELHIPDDTENDLFFESFFNYFQYVERLKLHMLGRPIFFLQEQRDYTCKMIEGIGHQLHQLRYFRLDMDISSISTEATMYIYDNLITTLCDWNQKLEILHLTNINITNAMLLDLCRHPKLHTLNLSGHFLHRNLTRKSWISFARKLKKQEKKSRSNGRLQSMLLSCGFSDHITDKVLEEFAGIRSLKTLRIEANKNISDAGVDKFASIKSCNDENYEKIELYNCRLVSSNNPHVIFADSPF